LKFLNQEKVWIQKQSFKFIMGEHMHLFTLIGKCFYHMVNCIIIALLVICVAQCMNVFSTRNIQIFNENNIFNVYNNFNPFYHSPKNTNY
jgi:hypothetical protein